MSTTTADAPSLSAATLAATTPSPPARIARIKIQDYRAFPRDETLILDLGPTGKNLLLYGENGSGKTSFARALRELTAHRNPPSKLESQRHLFGPPIDSPQSLLAVDFTGGPTDEFRWLAGETHPSLRYGQPYLSFARGCLTIDYRDLLETNYRHDGTPNLFECLVSSVLDNLPVLDGGRRRRLGDLHCEAVEARPKDTTEMALDRVTNACAAFTGVLLNHLPEVVAAAQAIFAQLGHPGTEFTLTPRPFAYDRTKRRFTRGRIDFEVTHQGRYLVAPQQFLNEARLTALALALYLGAAQVAITAPIPSATASAFSRVLIMDDVLIGLDLSNRLPLLRVLAEDFTDWQIILLTHDRVWFEIAKEYTQSSTRWCYASLHCEDAGIGKPTFPRLKSDMDDLSVAERHLAGNDLRAAAVYIRAAFESRLREIAERCDIKVGFKKDPKKISADIVWKALLRRHIEWRKLGRGDFIESSLISRISAVRSAVLNRLSHSGPSSLTKPDVQAALQTIRDLRLATIVK